MNAIKIMGAVLLLMVVLNLISLSMLLRLNRVPGGAPPPPSAAAEFLMRELQFTPRQRSAYMEMIQEHRQQSRALEKIRGGLRQQLFAGIAQNDTSALQGLRQVEGKLELLTFQHFQAVRKLATPAQQTHFDEIIQEVIRLMTPRAHHPKKRYRDE